MKTHQASLLSRGRQRRDALNFTTLNIKPRLILSHFKDFNRLTILFLITLFFLGYQPVLSFPPVEQQRVNARDEQIQQVESESLPKLQLPHPGYLSGRFSRWHPGIDIATGLGMPIQPVSDGVVEQVNLGFFGYGNHVIISHSKELKSLYGHMGRVFVNKSQVVTAEDSLGTVGLTGFTSGPHTHLEIQKDGKYINPLTILPPLQDYPSEEFLKPVGGKEEQKKFFF